MLSKYKLCCLRRLHVLLNVSKRHVSIPEQAVTILLKSSLEKQRLGPCFTKVKELFSSVHFIPF